MPLYNFYALQAYELYSPYTYNNCFFNVRPQSVNSCGVTLPTAPTFTGFLSIFININQQVVAHLHAITMSRLQTLQYDFH